jgi:proteasome lid subunit RPN8/RPN11
MSKTQDPKPAPAPRDFRQTDPALVKAKVFPASVKGELRVHIAPEAYRRMKEHAATTNEVELCGVLVGQVGRDEAGYFLTITGAIAGERAKNLGSQVTFTHDTWTHIHEVKDREFPDDRIVGWYHTHPGFGVFLSSMDTFIHENFFAEPYQVAIVLETVQKTEGCFAWVDGQCQPLARYWVGRDEVPLSSGPGDVPATPAEEAEGAKPRAADAAGGEGGAILPPVTTILMAALFLAVGVLAGNFWASSHMQDVLRQSVETEVYSVLEEGALFKLVLQDLKEVQGQVKAAGENLAAGKSAEARARLAAVDTNLTNLQAIYDQRPTKLDDQLRQMQDTKMGLAQRVEAALLNQRMLLVTVADLHLLRLQDMIGAPGKVDPSAFPPEKQASIRDALGRVIGLFPNIKSEIQKTYPGLMEFYYPPADETPKPAPSGSAG